MKSQNILKFILLFLFLTGHSYLRAQSDYKLAEQDSLALVAFYHATDGPNWTSNQNGFSLASLSSEWQGIYSGGFNKWLEGPVKDWFGVTVEKRPIPNSNDSAYRVIRIWPVIGRRTDGENQMKGYIPREVGLLTALMDFRVNGNLGFTGTEIPDEIYHKTLDFLDIEASWFDGDISNALRNCTSIRKMNFRYNNIDYMPTLDFLSIDALNNLNGTQWFYSTQISPAIFEKSIDYFYSVADKIKDIQLEMRDVTNVGDEIEIVAPVGTPVSMECTAAGEKSEYITYQWFKSGLSRFGQTKRNYSISSVKESDYGDYTVRITNDYVKEFDDNTNWGEIYTKVIHLVPAPVAPVIEWAKTSYNGKSIQVRFSKPMNTQAAGFEGFTISSGSKTIHAVAAKTAGRLNKDLILTLDEPIMFGENLVLNYSGNSVIDKNAGVLQTVSALSVENLVRKEPEIVSAITTKDGTAIELMFDNYIDASSIKTADFSISADKDYTFSAGTLKNGKIDTNISKVVLLTLTEPINDDTEVLKINYNKGSLNGYLSGTMQSFSDVNITNQVILDKTEVTLYFEDGLGELNNILVKTSWTINPIQLHNDGTNGDLSADDNIWTLKTSLVDESYTWDVISRKTIQTFDTTSVTDPQTGVITQTITPIELNIDSVLSESVVLEFQVKNKAVSGTTSFGIKDKAVTFNIILNQSSDQVYLMGIDDDWSQGILMTKVGDSDTYSVTLSGYTVGDVINYNFRDGDNWENHTAESRSYKVVASENIINDRFSVFTGLKPQAKNSFKIFPNPVSDNLNLAATNKLKSLTINNLSGQIMLQQSVNSDSFVSINVSNFESGLYFLKTIDINGITSSEKFIKTK